MTIDYSKWDNFNSDSEPEPLVPSKAHTAPVAKVCPPASTATPSATTAKPSNAVIVSCNVDKETKLPWYPTTLDPDHPIFSNAALPISELIEIPLVMHKVGTKSSRQADLDCQIATYLAIEPVSGFAPPEWQSHVGTVIIARKDKKPLAPQHMEGVWMFCDHILDIFGDGNGAPTHLYNKKAFEEWWKEYCENQRLNGRDGRWEDSLDGWDGVKSPYEI